MQCREPVFVAADEGGPSQPVCSSSLRAQPADASGLLQLRDGTNAGTEEERADHGRGAQADKARHLHREGEPDLRSGVRRSAAWQWRSQPRDSVSLQPEPQEAGHGLRAAGQLPRFRDGERRRLELEHGGTCDRLHPENRFGQLRGARLQLRLGRREPERERVSSRVGGTPGAESGVPERPEPPAWRSRCRRARQSEGRSRHRVPVGFRTPRRADGSQLRLFRRQPGGPELDVPDAVRAWRSAVRAAERRSGRPHRPLLPRLRPDERRLLALQGVGARIRSVRGQRESAEPVVRAVSSRSLRKLRHRDRRRQHGRDADGGQRLRRRSA